MPAEATMAAPALLTLRIRPRGGSDAVLGVRDDSAIEIRLRAAPVDGAANAALCRFLADRLGVPLRAVTIVQGLKGRHKRIAIEGGDAAWVRQRLLASRQG